MNGTRFFLRPDIYQASKVELEEFLEKEQYFRTQEFLKRALFGIEIKTNNLVEGYGDDLSLIEKAIKDANSIKDPTCRARILNLYKAYNYILKGGTIDKESLKELYTLTSENILEQEDLKNMGEYYRMKPVYILNGGRLDDSYDEGIPYDCIDKFMDSYFEFLNTSINGSESEEYIKSQILHLYFVYIHPYFDVNGRTSRTLAMWYLLNKKAFPYIIFNRGIAFKGSIYDKTICNTLKHNDMSYFIELMIDTLIIELEKEYVIHRISQESHYNLDTVDFQSLLYLLSMKGTKSIFDFGVMYNRYDEHKSIKEIYETMIEPLLDKGILVTERELKEKSMA